MKGTALSFRISEDVKAALERAAAADDRSVSSLVERVLRAWLTQQGHMPTLDDKKRSALGGVSKP